MTAAEAARIIGQAARMTPGALSQAAYEACTSPAVPPERRRELASLAASAYAGSTAPTALAA
jgi:hypothetical protein